MGGMSGGSSTTVYKVPWKLITPEVQPKEGLAIYWFPVSDVEFKNSSLLESRTLQLYSQQCVTMGVVDARTALGQKYVPDGKLPVAVLAQADGTVVGKLEANKEGKLKVGDLEKLLDSEIKKRENAVKEKFEDAKAKAKAGDSQTAIQELRAVYDQKCLFPKRGKDAQKELKKLGVEVAEVPDAPNFDPAVSAPGLPGRV